MTQPSAGSQPDPKKFLDNYNYSGRVAQVIQDAQDERTEKYPLLTGQVGTTILDRKDYYV
jgi:hypothetical protein